MLSGGKGLGIRHQGHLELPKDTPLPNLWRTMMGQLKMKVPAQFHDSTGIIKELIHA
jgi:hypothetical protein